MAIPLTLFTKMEEDIDQSEAFFTLGTSTLLYSWYWYDQFAYRFLLVHVNKPSPRTMILFLFLVLFFNFRRTQVLSVGLLIPLLWTSGDVCNGFLRFTSDATPAGCIEVNMAAKLLIHVPTDVSASIGGGLGFEAMTVHAACSTAL